MEFRFKSLLLLFLTGLVFVCICRRADAQPQQSVPAVDQPVLSFPYVAEIIGDNVLVRSGPGSNYYACGRLNRTDRVKVVAARYDIWSQVVPPEGTFSWIAKRYVRRDPADPAVGIVTADAVNVRAGSDDGNPIHSTTPQLKLDTGGKVTILGQDDGDYYKIVPPPGAYLWVSTQYTKPLGSEAAVLLRTPQEAEVSVLDTRDIEAAMLQNYYTIQELIDAEKAKPVSQQDYTAAEKALAAIADNEQSGKAGRYARFALKKIERCKLAAAAAGQIQSQDAHLRNVLQRIENARQTNLDRIQDLGGFAAVGRFETSGIYASTGVPRYYRVVDDSGKTLCYALPSPSAAMPDLSASVGRKVGLVGTIKPHPEMPSALVEFTEITTLK